MLAIVSLFWVFSYNHFAVTEIHNNFFHSFFSSFNFCCCCCCVCLHSRLKKGFCISQWFENSFVCTNFLSIVRRLGNSFYYYFASFILFIYYFFFLFCSLWTILIMPNHTCTSFTNSIFLSLTFLLLLLLNFFCSFFIMVGKLFSRTENFCENLWI